MYAWMNKQLKLGLSEPVVERDYQRLTAQDMTVWDAAHPKPPSGPAFEKGLLKWWHEAAQSELAKSRGNPGSYRQTLLPALEIIIGRNLDTAGQVSWKQSNKVDKGSHLEMSGLLRNESQGEELPVVWLHPKDPKSHTVVWLNEDGKAGLWDANGVLKGDVKRLLDTGATVVGVDLLFQGEFVATGKKVATTRRVKNPREFAGYTFGYNHTLFAQRTHDVLTVLKYVKDHETKSERLDIVALDGTGVIAIAARAVSGGALNRVAAETSGFRFGKVLDLHDVNFLPGGAKYDDLPGLLAVASPAEFWISGEDETSLKLARAAYERVSKADSLAVYKGTAPDRNGAAVTWLLKGR